jgi:general stress protein YciG
MTKEEAVKEYFANIGRKGGSVSGPQKARNMGREHYEKVSRAQKLRWVKWRELNVGK